jgi:hypothetical protein
VREREREVGRSANPAFTWTLSPFVALLRNWHGIVCESGPFSYLGWTGLD